MNNDDDADGLIPEDGVIETMLSMTGLVTLIVGGVLSAIGIVAWFVFKHDAATLWITLLCTVLLGFASEVFLAWLMQK